MATAQELCDRIQELIEGRLSLEAFEDWFAPFVWNIHKRADEQTQKFAYRVALRLAEHSSGDINDELLLKELAAASAPFVQRTQSPWRVVYQETRHFVASCNSARVALLEDPREGWGVPVVVLETGTSGTNIDRRPCERTTSVSPSVQPCALAT